jgi:hypothetical protein
MTLRLGNLAIKLMWGLFDVINNILNRIKKMN